MIRLTLIAMALALTCAVCVAQDNLCPNPGFEAVDDAGWAEGWTIWPEEPDEGAGVVIDDQSGTRVTGRIRAPSGVSR